MSLCCHVDTLNSYTTFPVNFLDDCLCIIVAFQTKKNSYDIFFLCLENIAESELQASENTKIMLLGAMR